MIVAYAVMFRMITKRSIQALFESFGTFFNNYEELRKYLLEKTKDYFFILMDRQCKSDKIADVYKALQMGVSLQSTILSELMSLTFSL
jgi:hypothetical protein